MIIKISLVNKFSNIMSCRYSTEEIEKKKTFFLVLRTLKIYFLTAFVYHMQAVLIIPREVSGGTSGKEPAYFPTGKLRDTNLIPGMGRFPGGGIAMPPLFLPEESHGQKSLADHCP